MDPLAYNLVDPNAAIMNGLKLGATFNQVQQQQQQAEAAKKLALQQQADLQALASNPNATHADYARVMTLYPSLAENVGKGFKVLEEGQRQNLVNFGARVYGALNTGNTQTAVDLLRERAKADKAGTQDWTMLADMAEKSPGAAKFMGALMLGSMMGPDKFATAFPALAAEQRAADKAPAELKKAEADAAAAVADAAVKGEQAKVAPQTVLLDLQKKGWDIQKLQADIISDKEKNRIAAMNAAISRESNDLKREELKLKIQETRDKHAEATREKAAKVESARTSIDNMLNTADRFLMMAVDPKTGKATSTLRAATGPIDSRVPTIQQDVADLEAMIETLGSQAFITQVGSVKIPGALTEKEGDKLQASLQNLKLAQSPDQLVANVKEAQRLILKARKGLVTQYGVPDNVPDTPAAAAATGADNVDALVQKYLAPQAAPGRKN